MPNINRNHPLRVSIVKRLEGMAYCRKCTMNIVIADNYPIAAILRDILSRYGLTKLAKK
jgi:hypothetical protein